MSTKHEKHILKDKVIICTYPEKEQDELVAMLSEQGATVLSMPMIEISPLSFHLKKDIADYGWLVFTSKNAVEPFSSQFPTITNKVAALGEQTAKQLQDHHIEPTFIGSGKSASDFVEEFANELHEDEQVLLVLGNLAPGTLQEEFGKKSKVDRINVYQTIATKRVDREILARIKKDQYDALIVTSPSAIKALIHELENPQMQLRIISIGKTTTAAILNYQMHPLATSAKPGYRELAETTIEYFRNN